ncbi:sce7726 family protein [Paenibacillus massiliensis]|uniref:sce7726 family protein n=1 Tax=Paenibacillus massiliensis TaxID=225917 RepID=UPI001B7FCD42|nr:sce7726 family protein [Paenibacillus massiliensis]
MIKVDYGYLNKFFTRKALVDAVFSSDFKPIIYLYEVEKNYQLLSDNYRNEFFFKNILFNKFILGKYSLNTSAAFSEVVINNSKADFVLINHSNGTVFEIKTDLDNLDRLIYQINDYYTVFNEVYVVTSEKNYYPVYKLLKDTCPNVGIIVLNKRKYLSVRKKANIDSSFLNHESIFKILRKKEYETILLNQFKFLPETKPVFHYKACLTQFKEIDISTAQKLAFQQLNNRNKSLDYGMLKNLPISLRWLIYSGNFSIQQLNEIYIRLNIEGV